MRFKQGRSRTARSRVPEAFTAHLGQICEILRKLSGRLEIKNADERRQVRPRQAVLHSEEFQGAVGPHQAQDHLPRAVRQRVISWSRGLHPCASATRRPIAKTRLQWRKADIAIGKAGVEATERGGAATVVLDEADIELPDILTDLQDQNAA